ncbi:MAG: acyltransferase [Candidatus Thorarchaeota archaeon]
MFILRYISKIMNLIRRQYYGAQFGGPGKASVSGSITIEGNPKNIIFRGKCSINPYCFIGTGHGTKISIGNRVRISTAAILLTYGLSVEQKDGEREHINYGDITLEDNVWIGAHAIILGGVRIGRNSVVAAGAIVTKDVPENCVAAGIPAKIVREI